MVCTYICIYVLYSYIYIYIYIMFSEILLGHKKRNLAFVTAWVNLKRSEISETEKDKHCMVSLACEI